MSDDVQWFDEGVSLELSCSANGCDNHFATSQATRKECRADAKNAGWRFGTHAAHCPTHARMR